jgi:hypothetical protein
MIPVITDPSWAPPHPLGITFHPNWAAVRARLAELQCNQIRRNNR